MLDSKILDVANNGLKRVFALSIKRSTFREVQNVLIAATNGNKELAETLLQALAVGTLPEGLGKGETKDFLKQMIDNFSIPIRLAREVLERGEFINVLTSDTLNSGDKTLFLNRFRRIDGEEFQIVTDPMSTVNILQHFVGRLSELEAAEGGRQLLNDLAGPLSQIKSQLERLTTNTSSSS